MDPEDIITYDQFTQVNIRSGSIIKAEVFERAKKPAYKIWADFGNEFGVLQTSAQITVNYKPENLIGKQILGCVNLGKKNIAGFVSEFLLLGFSDSNGDICLSTIDNAVPNGQKMH
jgi:tRNA-binding protein